jgi:hypothetical protein
MKNYSYLKINIKNITLLIVLVSVIILGLLPKYSYANNPSNPVNLFLDENRLFGYIEGNACGDKTCQSDEVCQKEYRGVLPIESDTTSVGTQKTTTFTCVKARPISAPASPYRGSVGCGAGATSGALGSILSGILISPFGPVTYLSDPVGSFTGIFNSLIGLSNPSNIIPDDECTYNNINQVIDSRRLTAPLPVDIFNPLPLPVNVTSPTPLPVVVVDDLALYQQKELIDAPLAAQQKAKTIATISDTIRYQISADNLILNNYFAVEQLGVQFGVLDSETGVVAKDAIENYGSYANFSLDKNNEIADYFRGLQDPTKSKLPRETFTEKCGNTKIEEADTFNCIVEGIKTNNNANDIADITAFVAKQKGKDAEKLLEQELRDGDGFLSTTNNNEKNPFIKTILTPGDTTAALNNQIIGSTIDQAIIASGKNCFEAIPNNILNGSLRPVLTQGLFNVNNSLSSVTSTVRNTTGNSLQDPRNFANQILSNGTAPNPDQFFRSLQDSLLSNITNSLSCVFTNEITGLLNGALGNISAPLIGNLNGVINNAVNRVTP